MPTSYAAAAYLRSIGFAQRALVLGTEGMAHEMEEAGIDYCTWEQLCSSCGSCCGGGGGSGSSSGGSTDADASGSSSGSELAELERAWTAEGFGGLRLDPEIGAVVVGWCVMARHGSGLAVNLGARLPAGLQPLREIYRAARKGCIGQMADRNAHHCCVFRPPAGTPPSATPSCASRLRCCWSCRAANLWPQTSTRQTTWVRHRGADQQGMLNQQERTHVYRLQ